MKRACRVISFATATIAAATTVWIGVSWVAIGRAQDAPSADAPQETVPAASTIDSSADPDLATTLDDPTIATEDLALLIKPFTLEQL